MMSRNQRSSSKAATQLIEVKSKFDAEFRRFSLPRPSPEPGGGEVRFADFQRLLETLHGLRGSPFIICYTDQYGDLLPINNDENYGRALQSARPMLRLLVQRQGESYGELNGYGAVPRKQNPLLSRLKSGSATPPEPSSTRTHLAISMPKDFRQVCAIIDVDVVPETHRRVKLMKNSSEKPLGFYIRDGQSMRATAHGVEKVAAIFISRLVPGGLAESTGLLAVNDEVLEVNGIEVGGKTLDQVTDMMVANSANLIITVKPVNQRNTLPRRGNTARSSGASQASRGSLNLSSLQAPPAGPAHPEDDDDDDEIRDYTAEQSLLGMGAQVAH